MRSMPDGAYRVRRLVSPSEQLSSPRVYWNTFLLEKRVTVTGVLAGRRLDGHLDRALPRVH